MAGLFLLTAWAGLAVAQEEGDAPPAPTRDELVEQLGDADFGQRESATAALLADDSIDEEALREMLLTAKTPEQRHRLMALARHHILRVLRREQFTDQEEAGAIGFSYDALLPDQNPHADHAGVVILKTLPGFPGHIYLRPNDVILQINGQPCWGRDVATVQNFVRSAIAWRAAGETHRLSMVREGERIEIEVPCVGASALTAMYTTSARGSILQNDFEEAWTQARQRLLIGLPEPAALTPAE